MANIKSQIKRNRQTIKRTERNKAVRSELKTRTKSAATAAAEGAENAAELVRAHGGEIRLVDGTIGATFRLTIPDRAVELDQRRERARA